jgi:hypothetical protein
MPMLANVGKEENSAWPPACSKATQSPLIALAES